MGQGSITYAQAPNQPPPTLPPGGGSPQPTAPRATQPAPSQPLSTLRPPLPQGPSPTVGAPGPVLPARSSGVGPVGVLLIVVALAAVVAGIVYALRRRAPAAAATAPIAPSPFDTRPPVGAPQGGTAMHDLLEVSRQLTAAATRGDIERAIVRGALELISAEDAALLACDDSGGLSIASETSGDLLVADALAGGMLGRVAETGQMIVQVSATERAIRNLPVATAAVPLVASGRVAAVLLLVRRDDQPFTAGERSVLQSLGPVAAAALATGLETRAARETTLVDPLTGVGNRRRLDADLDALLASPDAVTPSLVILDVDHFKAVNDTLGHPAGDALLRSLALRVRDAVRPSDAVYRFGGEEFCVLLPDGDADEAQTVAERVRAAVAAEPFELGALGPRAVTISLGVVTRSSRAEDAVTLLARADSALYAAKDAGRNRVVRA